MTTADNIAANSDKIAYTTYFPIDRVIYSATQTISVNNVVSGIAQTFDTTTGIGIYARPMGIYSTDSGTTWNDMAVVPDASSLTRGVTKPSITVTPLVDSGGVLRISVVVNALVGGGATFSLLYSVVLLAEDAPAGTMSTLPAITSGTTKTALANITPSALPVKYRRIISASTYTTTIGTTITTVSHGLAYVPDVMMWMTNGARHTLPVTSILARANAGGALQAIGDPFVCMDASNIYYAQWGSAQSYFVRLYQP